MMTTGSSLLPPSIDQIAQWLKRRDENATDLIALQAGGWSRAFAYRSHDVDYVLRLGRYREDYEKDRVASAWASAVLPVPQVLEVGDAFDGCFAISKRHLGTPLVDVDRGRLPALLEALFAALEAMRAVELTGHGHGIWLASSCDAPSHNWRDYLLGLAERDDERLHGWRTRLAAHAHGNATFARGMRALEARTQHCPELRQLVHNDLPGNILFADDDRISAIFDWGNALAGDPLYDIAWLCSVDEYFPVLEPAAVLTRARTRFDEAGFMQRIAAYRLHIWLGGLQYAAYLDDDAAVAHAAERVDGLLSN